MATCIDADVVDAAERVFRDLYYLPVGEASDDASTGIGVAGKRFLSV